MQPSVQGAVVRHQCDNDLASTFPEDSEQTIDKQEEARNITKSMEEIEERQKKYEIEDI